MNFKRILSLFMAAMMAVSVFSSTAMVAFAEEKELNIKHSYSNNGYTFEKLSHASLGTETPDGVVDYIGNGQLATYVDGVSKEGMGDTVQSYSYCGAAYGDWIYVGTMYGALSAYNTIKNSINGDDIPEGLPEAIIDAMFNGKLNKGQEDDGTYMGSVFFKFNVKTGETKILMSRDMYNKGECNGVPIFRSACEYNGKLYFVGLVSDGSALKSYFGGSQAMAMNYEIMIQAGVPCIYEVDPENDDKVTEVYRCVNEKDYLALLGDAFYSPTQVFTSTRAINTYKDYLIAGGIQKADKVLHEGYTPGEAVLLATNDPAQENFKVIANMEDLFNYPAIWRDGSSGGGGIYQVIEFNDSLYVAICSGTKETQDPVTKQFRPFAVVRGDYDASKGAIDDRNAWTWTPVIGDKADGAKYTFGIDPERSAAGCCTLEVLGDHLYIGDYNDVNGSLQNILKNKSFATLAANLDDSINLYRMGADEKIEMVVGDPTKMFPKSLTGIGSGFATHMSQYTWMTNVYKDTMYLSLMDESSLLRSVALIPSGEWMKMDREEWASQLNYLRVVLEIMFSEKKEEVDTLSGTEMTDEEAEAIIDAAIAAAEKQDASELAPQSLSAIILTAKQRKELVQALKCRMIAAGMIQAKKRAEWAEFIKCIQNINNAWEKSIESTIDSLIDFAKRAQEIKEQAPEAIKQIIDLFSDEETQTMLKDFARCLKYLKDAEAGFDLVAIKEKGDKVDIQTVSTDGFGDRYNHGLRIFVNTDDYMAVGTANPFLGTQLWRMSDYPCYDHHMHTLVTDEAVAATCTETGLTEGKHCSVCGEVTRKQRVIPATGHTESTIVAVDATCTKTGLTEGTKCSVCDTILVAQETIPATGHTETTVEGTAATCTVTGLTDATKCSVCDAILVDHDVIPAKGHTETTIEGTAATCTETGLTDGTKCSVCDTVLVEQKVIPAKGHTYGTTGADRYTCTTCGKVDAAKKAAADAADAKANKLALDSKFSVTAGSNITVKWGQVADADGYDIYLAYCGQDDIALVKSVKAPASSLVVKKLNGKKIDQKKYVKGYVVAYKLVGGKKVTLAKSVFVHVVGKKNTKATNAKQVKVSKSAYTLKVGGTANIKASTVKVNKKRKLLKHTSEFRYVSYDNDVATVSHTGKITAKKAGTCKIRVFSINGVCAEITVTVK